MLFPTFNNCSFVSAQDVGCTKDTCSGETVAYCVTCQVSNPITWDGENFAKTFQTFPTCKNCNSRYHNDHAIISANAVSFKYQTPTTPAT